MSQESTKIRYDLIRQWVQSFDPNPTLKTDAIWAMLTNEEKSVIRRMIDYLQQS